MKIMARDARNNDSNLTHEECNISTDYARNMETALMPSRRIWFTVIIKVVISSEEK